MCTSSSHEIIYGTAAEAAVDSNRFILKTLDKCQGLALRKKSLEELCDVNLHVRVECGDSTKRVCTLRAECLV